MAKVLIVEDDTSFAKLLSTYLTRKQFSVTTCMDGPQAEKILKDNDIDVVVADVRLPAYDGATLLTKVSQGTPVIMMTGYAEVTEAVRAIKLGAYDYVEKPFTPDRLLALIEGALKKGPRVERHAQISQPYVQHSDKTNEMAPIDLRSAAAKTLGEHIALVAPTDMSVLLNGESGTGKEVAARNIHDSSPRKDRPFVALDCGAIPRELAPSEFFGHVKGSFTGAITDHVGSFEAADGGTLFLDEVGNLSYDNQIHLLRALQERKVKPVGSNKEIEVNVRIISATNEDLKKAVEKGSFREDLYHRLNEFSLSLPPLRKRDGDLEVLVHHFLDRANRELHRGVHHCSEAVWAIFKSYSWPGNIRELQNVIKRGVLLSTGKVLETAVLPLEMTGNLDVGHDRGQGAPLSKAAYEKERILKALERTGHNKSQAAKLLNITRKTLYNRINQYGLDV
ncbi:sigma-54-dependent transcriptional regulator [Maribacter sp. 2307ULW6-5]|uniref:sigma-54-dependent transcriptional regulator n=1 Tax=Maribacter sp. 2307ULW6-5 TaxID=3386275 RepID=UPI0039BC9266